MVLFQIGYQKSWGNSEIYNVRMPPNDALHHLPPGVLPRETANIFHGRVVRTIRAVFPWIK